MGICLSCRCGEAQHKASVVAVSLSHPCPPATSPTRLPDAPPSRLPPNPPSLTTILRIWHPDAPEVSPTKPSHSPGMRAPECDSQLTIPHSSELFSLPSSHSGTTPRSSTSSASLNWFVESPKPIPPRGSGARRKSCSSLGPVAPRCQSLADTIARLEQFCDVKLVLENRTRGRSAPPPNSDFDAAASILLHESCRDLAKKLISFANEHAGSALSRRDAQRRREVVTAPGTTTSVLPQGQADSDAAEATGTSGELSSRFHEAEESVEFTDFEATFELRDWEANLQEKPASGASASAGDGAPELGGCEPSHRRSRTSAGGAGGGKLSVQGSQAPSRKHHHSFQSQASPGVLKKGCSQSLDLQSCSLSHPEFEKLLKSEGWQWTRGEMFHTRNPQRNEAKEFKRIDGAHSTTMERFANGRGTNAPSPPANTRTFIVPTKEGKIAT